MILRLTRNVTIRLTRKFVFAWGFNTGLITGLIAAILIHWMVGH